MKSARKGILLVSLLLFIIAAFIVAIIAIDKIEKKLYPQKYSELVNKYSVDYELSPFLVYALIHTESKFNPNARSAANAIGLTQMTEDTFDWVKSKIAREEELQFTSLFDPETSIRFGCYYLSECMQRYNNDISTAAAAYHSGWGTVDKLKAKKEYSDNGEILSSFPYEQMNLYVKKINKSYAQYQKLYGEE